MVPKVDTFARDISDEIKHKEASLADIATASNDIGNSPGELSPMENKSSRIFGLAIIFLVIGIAGLIGFIYYYFITQSTPQPVTPATEITQPLVKKTTTLGSLSVTLNTNIGLHVKSIEKKDEGYVLTLSSYSPVFAYMTRNESDYIKELLDVVSPLNGKPITKTDTKVSPATSTDKAAQATTTGTSTQSMSTNTSSTTPIVETISNTSFTEDPWSNVTLSNVNIRIYREGDRAVAYSFVSAEKIIIARTPESVLAIKNAILR